MKIVVTGTRGIPDILGGVETHCQELYPRLADMGHEITVIRRSSYVTPDNKAGSYRGVNLVDVYAPRRKSLEAIVHTFLAVLKARSMRPDVLHIHAIGPSLMVPLARMLGMKVVTTNHGPDYDRQKWGRLAKATLRLGERLGARWSNRVIVISRVISDILLNNYNCDNTSLIPNGVTPPVPASAHDYLDRMGIEPGRYILAMGRFVKEKGFHDLIEAWKPLKGEGWQLVLAGDADHADSYSEELKARARQNGVILTGFIHGEPLRQVLSHAALFVLPSYHEGLPIALLEAMSYKLDVAVSDIPANRLPELDAGRDFFKPGDIEALSRLMTTKLSEKLTPRSYDLSTYNWDNIARQTLEVYNSVIEE